MKCDIENLELVIESEKGRRELAFTVRRLICAGWVGRDRVSLQAHIDELVQQGVPAPGRIPIYMNLSARLVSTAQDVEVISDTSSGEVEYVILQVDGRKYIGAGSDHTDRNMERFSIPASKQMYPKIMAPLVWPYEEVKDHWDRIWLRSWVTKEGTRMLYQEEPLCSILDVDTLLLQMPGTEGPVSDSMVLFSGTVPTKSGLVCGERFAFEMEDPVLKRVIYHEYDIRVLLQFT